MSGIRHSTHVDVPDDGTSPVGTDEWNDPHVIDDGTITQEMLAPGVALSGPTGATGAAGLNGKDGVQWLVGSSAPNDADGQNGDFYLNVLTGDLYQKASDSWF